MIIVVSDVHLGYSGADAAFLEFIESFVAKERVDHLVMTGDIIDFWRRSIDNVMSESHQICQALEKLTRKTTVHYICGNHDIIASKVLKKTYKRFKYTATKRDGIGPKPLVLREGSYQYRFVHGYQMEVPERLLWIYENGISRGLCASNEVFGAAMSGIWSVVHPEPEKEDVGDALIRQRVVGRIVEAAAEDVLPAGRSRQAAYTDEELRLITEHIQKGKWLAKPPPSLEGRVSLAKGEMHRLVEYYSKPAKERDLSPDLKKWRKTAEQRIALEPDEFLVFGHTHKQQVDMSIKTANSGNWGSEGNFYLVIDEGKIEAHQW